MRIRVQPDKEGGEVDYRFNVRNQKAVPETTPTASARAIETNGLYPGTPTKYTRATNAGPKIHHSFEFIASSFLVIFRNTIGSNCTERERVKVNIGEANFDF